MRRGLAVLLMTGAAAWAPAADARPALASPDVQTTAATPDSDLAPARALAAAGDIEAAVEAYIATAEARLKADRLDDAAAAVEEAMALATERFGEAALERIRPMAALARLRIDQGRYPEALALVDQALVIRRAGPPDPVSEAQLLYDLAKGHDALGQNEQAETAARKSYELRRTALGQVHEKTADALNLYANALSAQGRHAEADPAYRQVLGMYEVLHGPKDFHLAIVLSNLGNSLRRTGRGREAFPLYRRAVSVAEVSGDKVLLAQCLTNYGWYLHTQGDGRKAETQFRRAMTLALAIVGPEHPFTGVLHANIGWSLHDQGRDAEAVVAFVEGQRLLEAGLGTDSPDIVDTLSGHAQALAALGRADEAEGLFQRVRAITTARLAPAHPDTLSEAGAYAAFLIRRERPGDALTTLRRSLAALIGGGDPGDLGGGKSGGRDWRTSVRGAGPLFERRVEASWDLASRMGPPPVEAAPDARP